ncbi:LegC family aminotransferase [Novispirillum sp. DQ9]|uniref:LegC family aminotransferase n=1 Tax=Novispirillum sp. DQ9 TaxID=3398612 RepID=UPI003C7B8CE7
MATSGPGDFIPLCEPTLAGNEWAYIKDCLDTNWVSSVGAYVDRFENMVAEAAGARHAVAVVNGTAALHLALQVAGVGADDEVLTSTLTFIATANAIRYTGAVPVLVDAESDTWQMDMGLVEAFLRDGCDRAADGAVVNRRSGRRVSAIVPVHIHGFPVDMDRLMALAAEFGLVVVEDATEALGARFHGRALGSFGRLGCYSFNGNKQITTGGGGMIVTDDPDLARRARHLSTQAKAEAQEYIHDDLGYNYRLTNIQAAMGCAQMEKLDAFTAAKRRIAATYSAAFAGYAGLTPQASLPGAEGNMWLYALRVDPSAAGVTARGLIAALREVGIQARPVWQPMHLSPVHAASPVLGGAVAARLFDEIISLPCSVSLTEVQQARVIAVVDRVLKDKAPQPVVAG